MKILNQLKSKFSIISELLAFLWVRRLWWMIPMVVVLLTFGLLILFTQSSALAPCLYTQF